MENSGVFCDVQGCAHNINCQKCDLSPIKTTHHPDHQRAGVATPHYCQSYAQK